MDKFHKILMPVTEFQNDMKNANRSPIEQWLEDFTIENGSKDIVTLPSSEVYKLFMAWMATNRVEYVVNSVKFFVRLKNLNIAGIENIHTKAGNTKSFDIAKLEVYFNIIPDECSETTDETTDNEIL